MAVIFALSSRPAPAFVHEWPLLLGMKVVHLIEYGLLAFLWVFGLARGTAMPPLRVYALSMVVPFLWGVSDEIHQSFVATRTATVRDALTDLVAATVCVLLCAWLRPRLTWLFRR
jgi:VanZ family protein